jgi:hypothetical protein
MRRTLDFIFYVIVAATDAVSVSIIDIQRGSRRFGREQIEKKCTNIWFSGPEKKRRKIRFSFLYVTMAETEVGSVSNIVVQEQGKDTNTLLFLCS